MSHLDDPRVLFAAERTLMAWNRTAIALITLGFVIERFGLFIHALHLSTPSGQRDYSFIIGITLITFASIMAVLTTIQFHVVLKNLSSGEIPKGYILWYGSVLNIMVAILGGSLVIYLIRGFQ